MTNRDGAILAFGPYEIDTAAPELRRDGRFVRITPQAFRLLLELTAAPTEVVSRETLRRALWPDDTHVDFERSLNSAMRKLRAALNDTADAPRYVQTLPGRGYRFLAPVRSVVPARSANHQVNSPRSNGHALPIAVGAACALAACVLALLLWQGRVRQMPDDASVLADADGTTDSRALAAYRHGQALGDERVTDLSRAIEWFEQAVDLDADFAPARAALAHARATRAMVDGRDASELQRARQDAQRALRTDGGLVDAHLALGQVQLALDNDPAGAEIAFRTARALGADAGRHQVWLVWALHAGGHNADALRVAETVLTREPQNATLHAWRGMLLHTVQRYDDELVELERAASMDDASWLAALHLGLGYSRRSAFDRALPALKRAVTLSEAGGLPLLWLGRTAADAGDLATAEDVVRQLRDITRARGVSRSFADSVESHIAVHRQKTKQDSSSSPRRSSI